MEFRGSGGSVKISLLPGPEKNYRVIYVSPTGQWTEIGRALRCKRASRTVWQLEVDGKVLPEVYDRMTDLKNEVLARHGNFADSGGS